MPIPDYQSLMLPVLKYAQAHPQYRLQQAVEAIADELGLAIEERQERMSSGQQTLFASRVHWANTYLKKAMLIDGDGKGNRNVLV